MRCGVRVGVRKDKKDLHVNFFDYYLKKFHDFVSSSDLSELLKILFHGATTETPR